MTELISQEPRLFIMGAFGVVFFLIWSVASVLKAREAERSRRELYAYVAEGSIEPKDAERLIRAASEDPDLACLASIGKGKGKAEA